MKYIGAKDSFVRAPFVIEGRFNRCCWCSDPSGAAVLYV